MFASCPDIIQAAATKREDYEDLASELSYPEPIFPSLVWKTQRAAPHALPYLWRLKQRILTDGETVAGGNGCSRQLKMRMM